MFNQNLYKKYPLLDAKTEKDLAIQYRDTKNPALKEKLVLHNLRFVIYMANKYYKTCRSDVKDDLIQEGTVGLMRAVEKFNPDKNIKLCSYARLWIQVYMHNYSYAANSPVNKKKRRADKSSEIIKDGAEQRVTLTSKEYSDIDWLKTEEDRPDELLIKAGRVNYMTEWLSGGTKKFNARELAIIKYRLLADEPETLQYIGNMFGITREAIRQHEVRLLANLRDTIDDEYRLW